MEKERVSEVKLGSHAKHVWHLEKSEAAKYVIVALKMNRLSQFLPSKK